jgi:hypothetical protein
LNEEIKKQLLKLPLLAGDIITMGWVRYYVNPNGGKVIWTGEKAIPLSQELENYGGIPEIFTFPEFPLDHFDKVIKGKTLNWLSPDIILWLKNQIGPKTINTNKDGYVDYIISASSLAPKYPQYEGLDKIKFKLYEYVAKAILETTSESIYAMRDNFYSDIYIVQLKTNLYI